MSAVVAERQLDFYGADGVHPGYVRVEVPTPDQNDWRCNYELEWPGFQQRHHTMGVDSYQALLLALQTVPTMIAVSPDFKAGRIGAFGEKIKTRRKLKEVFGVMRLPGFDP